MHTQTDGDLPRGPTGLAVLLPAAAGLGLFLLTLSVEVLLGAGARWLLVFLGAATIGLIAPIGQSAELLAWFAAAVPLVWSALALIIPGGGWLWRRRLGARQPTADEEGAVLDAIEILGYAEPPLVQVVDQPLPVALTRGRTLVLSRTLIEIESVPAVLAHELGHLVSLDARLTEALARLRLWDDPLAPPDDEIDPGASVLLGILRRTVRLAGGGSGERLLTPAWTAYWRAREYAADRFAAALGQGEDLAQHLGDFEQAFDFAESRLPFDRCGHPPVAHRVDRLLASSELAVSE
jgi:Zn-dependent protease with chaperone function